MKSVFIVSAAAGLALATGASAQYVGQTKLEVGSDAPKLTIKEWVKGDKVEAFEEGHVYVIEFWATWCGPCRQSIPHLTKLQEQLGKEVTIIGVSDEEASIVKPFVTGMGEKMEYTVAVDDNKSTNRDWMQAAGQNGIPCAFVVDQSKKIAWIGHPMELDTVLGKVASGRYDPELEEWAKPLIEQINWSVTMRDWQAFDTYVTQVVEENPRVFNDIAIKKFRVLLLNKGDVDGAIEYLAELSSTYADDPETLSQLAELILTDATILKVAPDRLKPEALALAQQAAESSDQPEALRVYATALYQNGRAEEAIEVQKRAYFMVEPSLKEEYQRALEQYQDHTAKRAGIGG